MDGPGPGFDVGTKTHCLWREPGRENTYHPCEIIEKRLTENGSEWEYYIHFEGFNRRLDQWVHGSRFRDVPEPSSALPKKRARSSTPSTTPLPMPRALDSKPGGFSPFPVEAPSPAPSPFPTPESPFALGLSELDLQDSSPLHALPSPSPSPQPPQNAQAPPPRRGGGTQRSGARGDTAEEEKPEAAQGAGMSGCTDRAHMAHARVKNIQRIALGRHDIETWYFSPYPKEIVGTQCEMLYLCEFCLGYFASERCLLRHSRKCPLRHPPGDEIFRQRCEQRGLSLSMFEVEGTRQRIYCQNLALLAKLFLDHKMLYYDVEPFLFYVLCEVDQFGCHVVGYFSKEKESPDNYNLSCIATLPPYQQKGYGKLLIHFCYLLSRKENRVGTPERPLSDLGLLGFRSYWKDILLGVLRDTHSHVSIQDLSDRTCIKPEDIQFTLSTLELLKYWKGQYVIVLDEHLRKSKPLPIDINPRNLHWIPLLRDNT